MGTCSLATVCFIVLSSDEAINCSCNFCFGKLQNSDGLNLEIEVSGTANVSVRALKNPDDVASSGDTNDEASRSLKCVACWPFIKLGYTQCIGHDNPVKCIHEKVPTRCCGCVCKWLRKNHPQLHKACRVKHGFSGPDVCFQHCKKKNTYTVCEN